MHALEIVVWGVAIGIAQAGIGNALEVAAKPPNGANPLVPISLDLGNATLAVEEFDDILTREAALINILF